MPQIYIDHHLPPDFDAYDNPDFLQAGNTKLQVSTSSYPGWIKSPHVVTLGILKISDKSEVFRNGGGIPE